MAFSQEGPLPTEIAFYSRMSSTEVDKFNLKWHFEKKFITLVAELCQHVILYQKNAFEKRNNID